MGDSVKTSAKVEINNIHFFPKMQHAASYPLPPQCGGLFPYWNGHDELYLGGIFLYLPNRERTLHDLL